MIIDFKEKVAVVTGGAGGIGTACVRELLDSNARVAALDMSEDALQNLCGEMDCEEKRLRCYRIDITDVDMITTTVRRIREDMGEIEVLIQTAGFMKGQDALNITPQEWDMMFQVNTRGLFFMMQQIVAQSMMQTGGSIVNFASMAGIRGMREGMESAHYSASKGAVTAMTRQAATEWAKYGIRCNAVAPGGVMTEAMKKMGLPKGAMDPIPLRRLSVPEDIAESVVFLASGRASMITGQTLVIDGGSSIVGY